MVKKTMIPATKKLGKELIKEASPEHKLRVYAYVKVHRKLKTNATFYFSFFSIL